MRLRGPSSEQDNNITPSPTATDNNNTSDNPNKLTTSNLQIVVSSVESDSNNGDTIITTTTSTCNDIITNVVSNNSTNNNNTNDSSTNGDIILVESEVDIDTSNGQNVSNGDQGGDTKFVATTNENSAMMIPTTSTVVVIHDPLNHEMKEEILEPSEVTMEQINRHVSCDGESPSTDGDALLPVRKIQLENGTEKDMDEEDEEMQHQHHEEGMDDPNQHHHHHHSVGVEGLVRLTNQEHVTFIIQQGNDTIVVHEEHPMDEKMDDDVLHLLLFFILELAF